MLGVRSEKILGAWRMFGRFWWYGLENGFVWVGAAGWGAGWHHGRTGCCLGCFHDT